MSEEAKTPEVPTEVEPTPVPEEPRHKWEHRNEFKINGRMKEVVKLAISTSESELAMLRKKLAKLTYGS